MGQKLRPLFKSENVASENICELKLYTKFIFFLSFCFFILLYLQSAVEKPDCDVVGTEG